MNLIRAITTVGGFTMISRILGFVRDILIAAALGAGPVADAFFVAFKLPNLFRRLFAEGAFSAAFVPIFAGSLQSDGRDAARAFAEQALSVLLVALLIMTALAEISMPWLMRLVAPGFLDEPDKFDLTVEFTRITFPYLLFISLVSLLSGVLNSFGKFAAAAATPVLLNLCLIGSILALAPYMPTPGHALVWGVAGAGVVQFVWLYLAVAREGMWLKVPRPRITEDVRLLCRRALPVAIGAGIYQINLVIDMIIASFLPSGSISYLFYADRVTQLPLGVVGVAAGTALLPLLSRQVRAEEHAAAMHSQNRAIEFSMLLTLPAAVALYVIAEPIIHVLFQRGEFGAAETAATAAAMAMYALGLPAYVLIKALAPGFFAREDTKTPVVISVIAMVINIVLALILMGPFLHVGLAMAMAAAAWLNAICLATILMRRGHLVIDARLKSRFVRVAISAAGMGVALYFGADFLSAYLSGAMTAKAVALGALVIGGAVVFALCALVTGAARVSDLKSFMRPAQDL